MDKNRFTDRRLGELVEIGSRPASVAFVPAALPTAWDMPGELWPLLMQAREALARLDGAGRHLTNPRLLFVPLQQREALRSSSMEGTYATPEELLLYQIDPREPVSKDDEVNAWREVFNYGKALQYRPPIQRQRGWPLAALDRVLSSRRGCPEQRHPRPHRSYRGATR